MYVQDKLSYSRNYTNSFNLPQQRNLNIQGMMKLF